MLSDFGREVISAGTLPKDEDISGKQKAAVTGVILSDLGLICGSSVGTNGKFCIDGTKCSVASHKATPRENGLYMQVGPVHALLSEFVPITTVDKFEGDIRLLQSLTLSKVQWQIVIDCLKAYSNATTRAEEDAAFNQYTSVFEHITKRPMPPSDMNKEAVPPTDLNLTPMVKKRMFHPSHQDGLPDFEGELDQDRKADDKMVDEHMESIKKGVQEAMDNLQPFLSDVQMDLRKVAAVQGKLGLDNPPLATSVSMLGSQMDDVTACLARIETDFKTFRDDVSRLQKSDKAQDGQLSSLLQSGGRLEQMDKSLAKVKVFCSTLLKKLVEVQNGLSQTQVVAPVAQPQPQVDVSQYLARLESLENKLDGVQKQGPVDVIKVDNGRWTIHGKMGVKAWLRKNGVIDDSYSFEILSIAHDPVALVEMVNSDGVITKEEFQREEVHHAKTRRTPLATLLASAGQSVYPASLMGARTAGAVGATTLSRISTYDKFNGGDGVSGLFAPLLRALEDLRSVELQRISDDLRDHRGMYELAAFLLEYSIAFTVDLFRWVDTHYNHMLVKMSVTSKAEQAICWTRQLTMLKSVFETMWEQRKIAKYAHSQTPLDSLVTYLYASLKTHEVMVEFKKDHFAEHPRIFPKLMTFVFESHTPRTELLALKQTHTTTSDKVGTLQRDRDNIMHRLALLERGQGLQVGGGGGGGGAGGGAGGKKKKARQVEEDA